VAERLGLKVIRHDVDRGYGGSNKTAFDYAKTINADIFVVLHSDCQYDPSILDRVLEPCCRRSGCCVRLAHSGKKALQGECLVEVYSEQILTWLENWALNANLSEYHTATESIP